MNVPLLDSKGNPMKIGKYYYVNNYYVDCKYLGVSSYDNTMMRFKYDINDINNTSKKLVTKYNQYLRPVREPDGYVDDTDSEDESDNDYYGGKSKKNTIKRRKRISNKKRKTNKKKKRRKSSKRRK
jgi:hypothetical protein